MKLLKRILWRLVAGIGVLWGAATLTFVTINITGGDPAIAILGGPDALPTQEVLARVRAEYGLDQPLIAQYGHYLSRLAHGDLGESYRLRIPVTSAIGQQIGATVELALWAGAIGIALSILFAILTARRARWVRSLSSGSELVVSAMPSFVIGILLLLVFSFHWHWFPVSRTSGWKGMVLPALTLALPIVAVLTQVLRQELEDILEQPFIVTARARGMSDLGVRLRHALRHAMIPVVTLSGFIFASLLGGAVVVETLFVRQGIGSLMVDATTNKDVPIVLGITLLAACTYVVVNIVVDLLYSLIDPRIRVA
ncbi:MAG TPA: ABC transporter permease [Oxalicibacterium sp.]|jgi:peptide/nickel transport system permease protein|nr:ABC transporter permease [Oxalicibacterium sp.]